jgi:MFS family permease
VRFESEAWCGAGVVVVTNPFSWTHALRGENSRVAELAIVVFMWQAAVGIYFLSLVQQYLPQELAPGPAWPGYAMACYGVAKFLWQPAAGWIADRAGR